MAKYIVKKGDNLSSIAKRNGLTLNELLKLNPNIKNADNILIGQNINLSSKLSKKPTKAKANSDYFVAPKYSYTEIPSGEMEQPKVLKLILQEFSKGNSQATLARQKEAERRTKLIKKGKATGATDFDKVMKLQKALRDYGYTGRIDGIWGKGSEAALARANAAGYDFDGDGNLVEQKAELHAKQSNLKVTPRTTGGAGYIPLTVYPESSNNSNIKPNNLGRAIYISFPDHGIGINGAFEGTPGDFVENFANDLGIKYIPGIKGHAGVLTIDKNGSTRYYDYGRYSNGTFGQKSDGNYRRVIVPNLKEENMQDYMDILSKLFGEKVSGTVIDDVDISKIHDYMENRANNKNRPTYNCVGNSCATEADEAIKAGWNPNLSFLDKTKAYILNVFGFNYIPTPNLLNESWLVYGYNNYESH